MNTIKIFISCDENIQIFTRASHSWKYWCFHYTRWQYLWYSQQKSKCPLHSLAMPTILVAGKGKGEMFYFFCFFTVIPVPLSSLSLSSISSTISSICFLPSSGRRHKMTHKGWRIVKPHQNPCIALPVYHIKILTPTFWSGSRELIRLI